MNETLTDLKRRAAWYARQLLPLTYRTTYGDADGNRHFCVWRMWFGRCFDIDDYIIGRL